MTNPDQQSGYGAASKARAEAFQDVFDQSAPHQTVIKAIIYVDGQEIAQSGLFRSGTRVENGRYSMPDASRETRMSRNDAEVGALQWAYEKVAQIPVAEREDAQTVQVDLVANNGTCNGCKVRQDMLLDDLTRMYPNARRSDGRPQVKVAPNYDDHAARSATRGRVDRRNNNEVLSVNGYNDATFRRNSYTADNLPEQHATYYQRVHTSTSGAGVVQPGQNRGVSRNGSPTSDRNSPHFTPTPPDSNTRRSSPAYEEPAAQAAKNNNQAAAKPRGPGK